MQDKSITELRKELSDKSPKNSYSRAEVELLLMRIYNAPEVLMSECIRVIADEEDFKVVKANTLPGQYSSNL